MAVHEEIVYNSKILGFINGINLSNGNNPDYAIARFNPHLSQQHNIKSRIPHLQYFNGPEAPPFDFEKIESNLLGYPYVSELGDSPFKVDTTGNFRKITFAKDFRHNAYTNRMYRRLVAFNENTPVESSLEWNILIDIHYKTFIVGQHQPFIVLLSILSGCITKPNDIAQLLQKLQPNEE